MSNQDSETFSNYFFMSVKNSLMWRNTTSGITNGMISSLKRIVEYGDSELESTNQVFVLVHSGGISEPLPCPLLTKF